MSKCYICDHEITAICARCGSELVIIGERRSELPTGTEIRIQPCGCPAQQEKIQMSIHVNLAAILNYPLRYNSISLSGPTLFYIDREGTPIQLALNDEQVQAIIDDWNAEPGDSNSHTLKPPRTREN